MPVGKKIFLYQRNGFFWLEGYGSPSWKEAVCLSGHTTILPSKFRSPGLKTTSNGLKAPRLNSGKAVQGEKEKGCLFIFTTMTTTFSNCTPAPYRNGFKPMKTGYKYSP